MPYAEMNGTVLHYQVVGKGPSIVCIHPILLTGEVFCHQLASLSDRFQMITFDIRGHGKSMYSKKPLTHTLIADDICSLLDMLGIDQAYLCGYSVGGQIALEALLTHPARFKGAILLGTMSELTSRLHRSLIWVTKQFSSLGAQRLLSMLDALGNADKPSTFKALYNSCKLGNALNIAQYQQQVLAYSCTARLSEIKAPILLLYGQKDTRFRRYAKELHMWLPNSTLHFIRGASHQIPTKHAADLQGLLRLWFMDKAEAPQQDSWLTDNPASDNDGYLEDQLDQDEFQSERNIHQD